MEGWPSVEGGRISSRQYTPLEKGALVADIESCRSRAKDGFAMVCVNEVFPNGPVVKCAGAFSNVDDLLSKLMGLSLTCSIADVSTALDDQILFIILVETDGAATNIDADVMDAISKLHFKE